MSHEKKTKTRSIRSPREQQALPATVDVVVPTPPEELKWHERAAFQVAFDHSVDADGQVIWQTRAYHEEADGRTIWPGIAGKSLMTWMRERADLPAESHAPRPPVAPAEQQPPADRPVEAPRAAIGLSVGALEVIELPAERQAGGEETGVQLCARVTFDLTGPIADLATADLTPYAIQVLALDLGGAKSALLASLRRELRPELASYSETLDLELPPVGSYQLIANVALSDHDAAAVAFGPALNVVP
jgi:hypothetical protein